MEGRFLQGREEAPAFQVQGAAFAPTREDGAAAGVVEGEAGLIVTPRVSGGAPEGRTPALLVEAA